MAGYACTHDGKVYGPDGLIRAIEGTPLEAADAGEYNRRLEAAELAHCQTGPASIFAYVTKTDDPLNPWKVETWLGTSIGTHVAIGPRQYVGFGRAYRRAMSCRIFGVLYHGWYMESSGDYCRLRRAKRQEGRGRSWDW